MIDPSVVRGLGYYTGPVFEAELTFEILDETAGRGSSARSRAAGATTTWCKRFTGEAVPATGVSIGVDRLLAALGEKGRLTAEEAGPVVVTVMDRDRMAGYQAMAAELRAGGAPRRGLPRRRQHGAAAQVRRPARRRRSR